ncbi:UNVERIFIED_CONTAM: hypothetical protein RMT77_006457 [Armadillidium vulgare]
MHYLSVVLLALLVSCYVEAKPDEEEQYEEEVVKDDVLIPEIDPEKVQEILASKEQTKKMVDCVIHFEEDCPIELSRVNRMAPDIFRRGGKCHGCSKDDQNKLRNLLVELQRKQPSEYRRLIRELNRI